MKDSAIRLGDVPETMLWTLHNRANEAKRTDTRLTDPDCIRIYESIAYDYERSFGKPDTSHPMRSRIFDDAVIPWMKACPGGTVVELGAGLETQFQRCDDGKVQWLCVDVPEAIEVRERFLSATPRCRHLAISALDRAWLDAVDPAGGVFVTAQGLFMYFEEGEVKRLFTAIVERFPGVRVMFDTIPKWFARKTLKGYARTKSYTAPPMPWGVDRDRIEPLLRKWSGRVRDVEVVPYGAMRGLPGLALKIASAIPWARNFTPCIVNVGMAGG